VSITAGYIYVLLRLRWLAPDITTAIVNGQQPLDLNAKNLCGLPRTFLPTGLNNELCSAFVESAQHQTHIFN
jgi:hypothetical protein